MMKCYYKEIVEKRSKIYMNIMKANTINQKTFIKMFFDVKARQFRESANSIQPRNTIITHT